MPLRCPECNSKNLILAGRQWSRNPETRRKIKRQQYRCKDCGRNTVYPKGRE